MAFVLTNGNIFTANKILRNTSLVIESGKITNMVADAELSQFSNNPAIEIIDLKGHLLAPGFIDTQVNGGAGVLFNHSPTLESIIEIGKAHRAYGTTGFLPTLISDDTQTMQLAIHAAQQAFSLDTAGFLGIHLEGPYLNTIRKGVHSETKLTVPDQASLALLKQVSDIGSSMVTLAPEMVPKNFIKALITAGVIVSIGHSNASYDCIQQSLSEGASGFTHLYNAMSPLTSREPGVVGAALNDPNSWCGIIVDGHHVHPCTLNIAINAKANGKIMLVSDAVHTVGVKGTQFDLAGRAIFRENGKVTTSKGTLAGSDLDMASAVRNTVQMLGVDLQEALRMASLYPAQFLKLDHKLGRIQQGYQADLVLLDSEFNVRETWIKGQSNR